MTGNVKIRKARGNEGRRLRSDAWIESVGRPRFGCRNVVVVCVIVSEDGVLVPCAPWFCGEKKQRN